MNLSVLKRTLILAFAAVVFSLVVVSFNDQPAVATNNNDDDSFSVGVLVLDSYRATYNSRGVLKPRYRAEENCILAAQGDGFATRGAGFATRGAGFATRGAGFATRGADGELFIAEAHGEIIELELDELNYYYGDNANIEIVPVKINDYETKKIVRKLRQVINRNEYDFYVINMSFTIVPCDVVSSFDEYLEEISDDPDYPSLVQVGEYLESLLFASNYGQVATDEFGTLFTDYPNVVGVASAGNFGRNFPFYPAAFDGVVSVSGSTDYNDFYSTSTFVPQNNFPLLGWDDELVSNYGEVMMPGQLLDIFGTSYAAPRLSYAIALYLSAVGPDYCLNERGSFGLDSDRYENRTLREAVNLWCGDMIHYLPTEVPWDYDGDGWVHVTGYLDVEDSPFSSLRGWWSYRHSPVASGNTYVVSTSHRINHIEVEFSGPYVDVYYIDGVVTGRVIVYVDDRRVGHFDMSSHGPPTRRAIDFTRLGNGNHTLELYVQHGRIAIDGIYSMFHIPVE